MSLMNSAFFRFDRLSHPKPIDYFWVPLTRQRKSTSPPEPSRLDIFTRPLRGPQQFLSLQMDGFVMNYVDELQVRRSTESSLPK